jgi:chemotaxis protein MotB
MAKGGGGAWKVAYADFVTAMMAFFLVMWICGQDQKMKQSIARYFNNPLGVKPLGESAFPDSHGNIFHAPNNGEVPGSEAINLGMGRRSFSTDQEDSPTTRVLSDFITSEDQQYGEWEVAGHDELEKARVENKGNLSATERVAVSRLAEKMRAKFLNGIPESIPDIYRDILFQSLNDINWDELAEDVVIK